MSRKDHGAPTALSDFDKVATYPHRSIDGFYSAKFGEVYQFVLILSNTHDRTIVEIVDRNSKDGRYTESDADFLKRTRDKTKKSVTSLENQGIHLIPIIGSLRGNIVPCEAYLTPNSIAFYLKDKTGITVNNHFETTAPKNVQAFMGALADHTQPDDWIEVNGKTASFFLNKATPVSGVELDGNFVVMTFESSKYTVPKSIHLEVSNPEQVRQSILEQITSPAAANPAGFNVPDRGRTPA